MIVAKARRSGMSYMNMGLSYRIQNLAVSLEHMTHFIVKDEVVEIYCKEMMYNAHMTHKEFNDTLVRSLI